MMIGVRRVARELLRAAACVFALALVGCVSAELAVPVNLPIAGAAIVAQPAGQQYDEKLLRHILGSVPSPPTG